MRQHWCFHLLLITTLLLSSCQTTEMAAAELDMHTFPLAKVNPLIISFFAKQGSVTSELEVNECLNCHSDKERLIETAEEEEIVESESSGVG